ncbi:MAG TPA: hypothetical protein VGR29_04120 [Thermomicrobiales bacterium]|nr:hypothetical protein [Thermomicrobiales bacterium]
MGTFLYYIVVGIAAGWLAGVITRTDRSIWGDLILGLVGAFVAGIVADEIFADANIIVSIVIAAIFAAILVWLKNLILNRR